jgi:hypothetical protein
MKNILAENMLRFGPRNLSESEKQNLQRLVEVNETYWDSVPRISNNPNGKKQVGKQFAASNPLTFPNKGQLIFTFDKKLPVYIGAYLQAQYSPLEKLADSASGSITGQFGYNLTFFLADTKGSTNYPKRPEQADWFIIRCAQIKSGKFQILTNPAFTPEFKVKQMDVQSSGENRSVEVHLSYALKNLDGWMGTLRGDINIELAKMGFPAVPNSLTWNGIQDV